MLNETFSVKAYRLAREGFIDVAYLENDIFNLQTLFFSTTSNQTLSTRNHNVSANAISGTITITLPLASTCAGRSFTITKTDSSSNYVRIASSSSIVGSSYFDLLLQYESITFVSNGTMYIAN